MDDTMDIKTELYAFLDKAIDGTAEVSEETIEQFGKDCMHALRRQLTEQPKNEYKHRMSAVGKPLCQLQMHKNDAPKARTGASTKMKFIFGDMIEALVMVLLKESNVPLESEQDHVELQIGGALVPGTLDVIIGGKVYDIKSASDFGFKHKFKKGFDAVAADDSFGYVSQGYLYGKAKGLPFGGWIVVNKNSGGIHVTETPDHNPMAEVQAVAKAAANIEALDLGLSFKRCFTPVPEKLSKVKGVQTYTGNSELAINCRYCDYKKECWGADLSYQSRTGPKGGAKPPKWYVGTVSRGDGPTEPEVE